MVGGGVSRSNGLIQRPAPNKNLLQRGKSDNEPHKQFKLRRGDCQRRDVALVPLFGGRNKGQIRPMASPGRRIV